MEPRRWHAAYPPGLATEIDLPPGETLAAMLDRSIASFAERVAVTAGDESLTYAELGRLSTRLAAHFAGAGLRQGDRVALMLPNGLAFPIAMTAILRSGLVGVPVNPLYTPRELAHQLADAGVRCIVLAEALREALEGVILEAGVEQILTAPAAGLLAAIAADDGAARDPAQRMTLVAAIARAGALPTPVVRIAPADAAFLQYTGGTTGLSKGAVLTHRSVGAGVLQSLSWIRLAIDTRAWSMVAPLPLYHIYPLQMSLITFQLGGVMRLIANPRDPGAVIAEMKRAPFLVFIGVNTLFNALVNAPALSSVDFSGTGLVIGAGASIQQAVSQRWHAAGGPPITEAYGLTETSPSATFNPAGRNGSIGIPVPSTDARIVDDDGRPVPDGTPGELWLKGPQLFAGYWQREEDTRKALTEDGFFRTGDVVVADASGAMTIVDRKKDMILVSGFNVYPNEIEAVVAMHEGVVECACIGQPDARSGEAPHLFVVRRSEALTAGEVEAHCRANLAGYKVPRQISFLEALPKSTVGKILRRELRQP
ncbi:AMP-binding protein [Variovorax sp. J31P207]|uniref:AMP-binding protein n=1 Tax=Variovorax sp. J31P207 TaxID=3053510 RepID=UPI0025776F80|nr:AMP-binding protein [Variovorax sp. J31P207]MDM0069554.1 AMP-binding protein [Variovorax sp. J31P207]